MVHEGNDGENDETSSVNRFVRANGGYPIKDRHRSIVDDRRRLYKHRLRDVDAETHDHLTYL